jgi:hypothetical protein
VLININCEFVLLQFYMKDSIAIYFTDMDNLSLTYELYGLVLLDCQIIYKILSSLYIERSMLLKGCVLYPAFIQ